MKYLLIMIFSFLFSICHAQKPDSITAGSGLISGLALHSNKGIHLYYTIPSYPDHDTVKCLFLEILDMDSAIFKWTSGFVARHGGYIDFFSVNNLQTSVQPPWLPVTDGVVKSKLFYNDMSEVKNKAIKVIIKPLNNLQ